MCPLICEFHRRKEFKKSLKMLFISPKMLFLLPCYSNFCKFLLSCPTFYDIENGVIMSWNDLHYYYVFFFFWKLLKPFWINTSKLARTFEHIWQLEQGQVTISMLLLCFITMSTNTQQLLKCIGHIFGYLPKLNRGLEIVSGKHFQYILL